MGRLQEICSLHDGTSGVQHGRLTLFQAQYPQALAGLALRGVVLRSRVMSLRMILTASGSMNSLTCRKVCANFPPPCTKI